MNRENKRSRAAMVGMVNDWLDRTLPDSRLSVGVRDVVYRGSPPSRVAVFLIVRFLIENGPHCCAEPACYCMAFRDEGQTDLADFLKREMNLVQNCAVEIKYDVELQPGIVFEQHRA